jgi:hypothetical protein
MVEISLSGSGEGPGASKRPGLLDNRPSPRSRSLTLPSRPSNSSLPSSLAFGATTGISRTSFEDLSAPRRSTRPRAIAVKGAIESRASAPRQVPTPSRVRRCAWPSLGATSRREISRRAKRGSTASRPCCTAWGLGAEPRSSGLSVRSFERHPTVQSRMPRSLVDAPNPYARTLPPCVERPWSWFGRPCKFAMTA